MILRDDQRLQPYRPTVTARSTLPYVTSRPAPAPVLSHHRRTSSRISNQSPIYPTPSHHSLPTTPGDYGRLDQKQLKFAKAARGRLGSGFGCEWYARGDGTTALFFTTEAVHALAEAAGLCVSSVAYDRRLVVNRASGARMHRVWVVAQLTKPAGSSQAIDAASSSLVGRSSVHWLRSWRWTGAVGGLAAALTLLFVTRGLRRAS